MHFYPPAKALLGRGSLLSTYDKRKRDGIELKSVSLEMGLTSQSVESEMGVFQEQLHSELEKDNFPRNHDYDGALKGLIVIHNTYRFELFRSLSPESCVTVMAFANVSAIIQTNATSTLRFVGY